jgi:hypothetical protein
MNNGLSRFTFYTQQIKILFNKAREQKNPGMWLFNNNARTPFFMLEGLAKIYADMHNTKKFGKLKEHFELIEDGLGQIDYYLSLSIAFAAKKQIPTGCKQYIKKQLDQRVAQLNEVLADKDWLSDDNKRIKKITKKLNGANWLNPTEEVEAISGFYKASIATITEFVAETNYHFDNVEKDVHELRRKLRWLSIYPQALQGAIQYATDTKAAPHLKKYLTKEIINSPYNKFPAADNNTSFFMLHKSYFLALSWMIAQLGSLKDEGLLLTGLCEAIKQNTCCNEEETLAKAYTLLGRKQRKMQAILDNAETITKTFFKENNLQHLIARTITASSKAHLQDKSQSV